MVRSKLAGATHLAKSYFVAFPYVAYRMTVALVLDPKAAQQFVHRTLDAIDVSRKDTLLGSRRITEIVTVNPERKTTTQDIRITAPYYDLESSDTRNLIELASLAFLCRSLPAAATIFEIGTFVGRTTRLFAQNSDSDSKVFSLDLPQNQVRHVVGRDYANIDESYKINQLTGDSKVFDFSPYYGLCDFVWVDGNHDLPFVQSDTSNALKLVKPGGWIGWHDYHQTAYWSGVTKTLRELKTRYPTMCHLQGTTTVLLQC